jgi:soluble lytic murein transglycosylase-like protein
MNEDPKLQRALRYLVYHLIVLVVLMCVATAKRAFAQVPANANIYRVQLRAESQRIMGINAPVSTLAAQITQESYWQPRVTAWDGGRGLSQFMPATLSWACEKFKAALAGEPCDAYRPRVAIRLQAAYMQHLIKRVDEYDDDCNRMGLALMGYNSGEGWRIKRQARSSHPGNVWVTAAINPGVTPANQRVAQDYPRRILLDLEPHFVAAGWGLGSCA